MNLKKTARIGIILAASAAFVATLINDKKNKEKNEEAEIQEN